MRHETEHEERAEQDDAAAAVDGGDHVRSLLGGLKSARLVNLITATRLEATPAGL